MFFFLIGGFRPFLTLHPFLDRTKIDAYCYRKTNHQSVVIGETGTADPLSKLHVFFNGAELKFMS